MAEVVDPAVKGSAVSFEVDSGLGFVTPADGVINISVHDSSINAVDFRSLSAGGCVEFNVTVGDDRRKRAVNVTAPDSAYFKGTKYVVGDCRGMICNIGIKRTATLLIPSSLRYKMPYYREEDEIIKEFQKGEYRNWAELPLDILLLVFKKIAWFNILTSVQYVCKPWKHLSHEPQFWRCINITEDDFEDDDPDFLIMAAVNMSKGCLEEFYTNSYMSNELIFNISERAPRLRYLRLVSVKNMTDEAFAEAITRFPLLEELEISFSFFSSKIVSLVGQACPQLKSFKLNGYLADFFKSQYDSGQYYDIVALSIAKHMQQLTHLQLIQNTLTNAGLLAILNDCPNIQNLDIRGCFNLIMDEHVMEKCTLKDVRFPNDSTADYEFKELFNWRGQPKNGYYSDYEHYDDDVDSDYISA